MDCTNCALGIKRTLDKSGFQNVDVDFASGRVSFEEEDEGSLAQAVKSIESLGYKVENSSGSKKGWFHKLENRLLICSLFTLPLLAHMFLPWHFLHSPWVQLVLASPVYLIGLFFFGRSALNSVRAGVANMDVLVILGASAAFFYSLSGTLFNLGPRYQFYESAATIITVIMLGNLLEKRSVRSTTAVVDELEKLSGETARRIIKETDHIEEIRVDELQVGDWVQINMGDAIPADGLVLFGKGACDEALMSGESLPVAKGPGDKVLAGSTLQQGNIRIEVQAKGNETVLSGIIRLVHKAQKDKPRLQNLADRISAVFVPAVVAASILAFLFSFFLLDTGFQEALMRGIAVLVVACPCALGLAIPTAVMVGIGLAARRGILIKKASLFDPLSRSRDIVFDKTGTLSTGRFIVTEFTCTAIEEEEALRLIYNLEKHSNHPLAIGLREFTGRRAPLPLSEIQEIPGEGIKAVLQNGEHVFLGSSSAGESHLELRIGQETKARITLSDSLRPEAAAALSAITKLGLRPVLLSGDREENAVLLAKTLNISEVHAGVKPAQKLEFITRLSQEKHCIMVGDGINDAPALGRASVGISFGNAAGISMNAAQIILLEKDLRHIPSLIRLSRLTQRTIRQNLFWVFFYNILMIPLAALGYLDPMIAAVAMALSDVIVVLNSLRLRWTYLRSESRLLQSF
jgi:P-type Cu+ transporter